MDALLLSRIQFGFTIGLHYLFPVSTLGLTLFIVILETLYFVKKTAVYKSISSFLIGLLGPIFIFGVATGVRRFAQHIVSADHGPYRRFYSSCGSNRVFLS